MGFEAIAISSSCPSFRSSRCAVRRSKPASVAPPIVSPDENCMIPETSSRCTGPSAWTPMTSPTSKSSLDAVSLSTIT